MDVSLKPELERLIADEVKSGRSIDPAELLDKAVYHYLVARDLGEEYSRKEPSPRNAAASAFETI